MKFTEILNRFNQGKGSVKSHMKNLIEMAAVDGNFMDIEYTQLYEKSVHATNVRKNLYKENTNVLSYYVIKTILLNNYQSFLEWCNTNNLSLLQFNSTSSNIIKFCKFIEKNYKINSMLDGVDSAENLLLRLKKQKQKNKFLMFNLRMSICELE
jgi:hypothetical protein